MNFWAIMVITTLSGPLEGTKSAVLYSSEDKCWNSITAVTDTLDYDYTVTCEGTDIPSGSIRPKARKMP